MYVVGQQFKARIFSTSTFAMLFFVLSTLASAEPTAAFAAQPVPPAPATGCVVSWDSWMNLPLSQTGTGIFRVAFDATPSGSAIDAVAGLSAGPASDYTSLAVSVRFNDTGIITARSGGMYTSARSIRYARGMTYHFILDVNLAAHTYNAYVMIGSMQTTIGLNLAFRTEQKGASFLSNIGAMTSLGSQTICNVGLAIQQTAPAIMTQPASQTVTSGQTATFSVAAVGTTPIAYRWMKNGVTISGATGSTYTAPPVTPSDNGSKFTVAVSNNLGSVTSNAATLTVNVSSALLKVSPTALGFGNVMLSTSASQSVALVNSGTSNVTISNVIISGAGFRASGISSGLILTPGQTENLDVIFAPAATGSVTGSVTMTSSATNSPYTITLSGAGVTQVQHYVSLSWNVSSSTVIGYYVYRATVSGGPYAKLNSTPTATTSSTDTAVQAGKTYFYVVTSVGSNNEESAFSSQVSVAIP